MEKLNKLVEEIKSTLLTEEDGGGFGGDAGGTSDGMGVEDVFGTTDPTDRNWGVSAYNAGGAMFVIKRGSLKIKPHNKWLSIKKTKVKRGKKHGKS